MPGYEKKVTQADVNVVAGQSKISDGVDATILATVLTTPTSTPLSTDNPLLVQSQDLDIRPLTPAVDEVKAIIRADSLASQTDPLKVTLTGGAVSNPVLVHGTASVSGMSESVVATYTVPAGKTFTLTGFVVGANTHGRFTVIINSVNQFILRNSAAERTIPYTLPSTGQPTATATQVVEIKGFNESGAARDFEATILGFTD